MLAGNWIGLAADGQSENGLGSSGITVQGDVEDVHIGGVLPADRNVISGSTTQVILGGSGGHVVENNYVGLDPAGASRIGDQESGIYIVSSDGNVIGGTTAASRNVIAVEATAIQSVSDGKYNRIIGNFIGTAADGVSKPLNATPARTGVSFYNDTINNAVGGNTPSEGNVIAYVDVGVAVEGNDERVFGNLIRHNSIFNTGQAINLDGDGLNDYGDTDLGGNRQQNFAAINSANTANGKTTVGGYLNSRAARGYVIDFFAIPADGKPYIGQAKTFLGSVQVITDGSGNASFTADLPATPAGTYLTNTVTSLFNYPFGDTSEVSPAVVVQNVEPPAPPAPPPSLSVANVSTVEGNSGTKILTFTVKLSSAAAGAVSVSYKTTDGTAKTGDNDYLAKTGTLNFAAGETTKTVSITLKGDTKVETNESFNFLLSSATGATISDGSAVGTITNDDAAPALPKISVGGYTAKEGQNGTTAFTFKITLDKSSASAITVKYATADDTAKAGLDYSSLSGTLTFAAGQTSKTVTVYVKTDHVAELEERFFLKLTSPTNATIAVGTGTGRILNDD